MMNSRTLYTFERLGERISSDVQTTFNSYSVYLPFNELIPKIIKHNGISQFLVTELLVNLCVHFEVI